MGRERGAHDMSLRMIRATYDYLGWVAGVYVSFFVLFPAEHSFAQADLDEGTEG